MKIFILCFFTFCTCFAVSAQSTFYYYNKKFKRVDSQLKASYSAYVPKVGEPSRVIRIEDGKAYAEGVIFPTDSLAFDGKAVFFEKGLVIKAMKFYKRGVPRPSIPVGRDLKKVTLATPWYLLTGENGEFCAYQRVNTALGLTDDLIYASGKILDTTTLTLDGKITFYAQDGDISDVKNYQNGQEIPFIVSTLDHKEPYETLGIISHSANSFHSIDSEMAKFVLKCKQANADGVIGVNTVISSIPSTDISFERTNLMIQGTIIRLKKKKEGE